MLDLVSIIIPMYNYENYVKNCLDNVSNQDYKNIEIICVVEQSDDNTLELVNNYAKNDRRIVVIKQKHQGAGVARNNGISHSKGRYLCFFDADDRVSDHYVSKMYEAISKNNSDLVVCMEKIQHHKESLISKIKRNIKTNFYHNKTTSPLHIKDLFRAKTSMAHDKMFSRDLITSNNLSFSDTYCLNDVKFVYSALVSAKKITFIKDVLYYYYNKYSVHRITNNRKNHKEDLITVFNELYEWLISNNHYSNYKKTFIRRWQNMFHGFCVYEYDEQFIKQICDYLSSCKPWNDMSDEELYRNCKFDLSLPKLKLRLMKIKNFRNKIVSTSNNELNYRIKAYSNRIRNIQSIRDFLKDEYGRQYVIKDNLITSAIRRYTEDKENG